MILVLKSACPKARAFIFITSPHPFVFRCSFYIRTLTNSRQFVNISIQGRIPLAFVFAFKTFLALSKSSAQRKGRNLNDCAFSCDI